MILHLRSQGTARLNPPIRVLRLASDSPVLGGSDHDCSRRCRQSAERRALADCRSRFREIARCAWCRSGTVFDDIALRVVEIAEKIGFG